MNLFILGLDGLEYNFVKEWNMENLMQQEYGKIIVPINKERNTPISPEVWGAFLTGEEILNLKFHRPGIKGRILDILISLRKRVNFGFGIGNYFRTHRNFPKLNKSTFVDRADAAEINAPYYSYRGTLNIIERIGRGELSIDKALKELMITYKKRTVQIKRELKKKMRVYTIIFAFLHFPDIIQHLSFTRHHLIKNIYADLDYFVLELKEILPGDKFIIVSDHGFEKETGIHSNYGFYSSNVRLNPRPEKITDFYNLIGQVKQSS